MNWRGKRVLVIGLGVQGGGISTVKWLARQGCKITVTDLKNRHQLKKSLESLKSWPIKYVLGEHPLSLLRGVDLVVQNPAVPNELPLVKQALRRRLPIANEASIFFDSCPAPIIAVTGSKGKSTVATLLGNIFQAAGRQTVVAGNIKDQVMLSILPKIRPNTAVVLELSSWQLEGLARFKKSPQIGVITNILPDHLDRYKDLAQYAKAKANIFAWQTKADIIVLNNDNLIIKKLARSATANIFWFSIERKVNCGGYVYNQAIWFSNGERIKKILNLKDVKLASQHNVENILAATTTAAAVGVKTMDIKKAILKFNGLHSRQELVRKYRGVSYVNDTTATIPQATQRALATFKNKSITLIAGGRDKNLNYVSLATDIKQHVTNLILFPGSATQKIIAALPKKYPHVLVKTMIAAVKKARRVTVPGGVVLLSPAAASFGTFINEWDRGTKFNQAVKKLT